MVSYFLLSAGNRNILRRPQVLQDWSIEQGGEKRATIWSRLLAGGRTAAARTGFDGIAGGDLGPLGNSFHVSIERDTLA